jgi:hypothetical protein
MLIKSNKGSNCILPLRNTINDEHLDEMVYDEDKKCELLNKYFSLVSKLEEENIPVPPFESKTNDSITDIFVTASEIVDLIQILDLKKAFAFFFILLTLFLCFLYFKVSLSLPNLKTFFLRRSRSRISFLISLLNHGLS